MRGKIVSRLHALAAAFRATNDLIEGRLRSRNVHSEIVFALSPNNNVRLRFCSASLQLAADLFNLDISSLHQSIDILFLSLLFASYFLFCITMSLFWSSASVYRFRFIRITFLFSAQVPEHLHLTALSRWCLTGCIFSFLPFNAIFCLPYGCPCRVY